MAQLDETRQDLGIDLIKPTEVETATADLMRTQFREKTGMRPEAAHQVEN